jgi:hypothetical protein
MSEGYLRLVLNFPCGVKTWKKLVGKFRIATAQNVEMTMFSTPSSFADRHVCYSSGTIISELSTKFF